MMHLHYLQQNISYVYCTFSFPCRNLLQELFCSYKRVFVWFSDSGKFNRTKEIAFPVLTSLKYRGQGNLREALRELETAC